MNKDAKSRTPHPRLHPAAMIRDLSLTGDPVSPGQAPEKREYLVGVSYQKFYRIGEPEYWILNLLDGCRSVGDIREEIIRREDLDIPLPVITGFIRDLEGYGLITYREHIRIPGSLTIHAPRLFYRILSQVFSPAGLWASAAAILVGLILLGFQGEEMVNYASSLYSMVFVAVFIMVNAATSFFHELGHGAAIYRFGHIPEPIHIRRSSDIFLLHLSIPFVIYDPDRKVERRVVLFTTAGGVLLDLWQAVSGVFLYALGAAGVGGGWGGLRAAGIFLLFTATARILLSANIFNEKSDLSRFIVYYTNKSLTELKKGMAFRLAGVILWLLQYAVTFFLIYVIVYSLRYHSALVTVFGRN